jgi:hypothetical protein
MKLRCIFLLIAFQTFIISFSFAQQDQGGFLSPNDSVRRLHPSENTLLLPKTGFILYDAPNGNYAGKIALGFPPNAPGTMSPTAVDSSFASYFAPFNSRPFAISINDYFETSDDCFHLSFKAQRDGFVQTNGGLWIAVSQILESGFKLVYWMDFYTSGNKLLEPRAEKKLVLRESPYTDAKIILEIDNYYFFISIDPETEGYFAQAKVYQVHVHPCNDGALEGDNILQIYSGWIQIIDEAGQPMIEHSPGGC